MHRRSLLGGAVAVPLLPAPHISRAEQDSVLRFVPVADLVVLDPVWTGARPTRNHGYLGFDTLYGLDETFAVRPQMAAGHLVENDGRRWTITKQVVP